MFGQQVIFEVGGQLYGFDSMKVTAVEAGVNPMTLAGAPGCIVGFTELRGELVPVCDLYRKFNLRGNLPEAPSTIFVQTEEGNLGCMVDQVREIGAVTNDIQVELPYIARMDSTSYVDGIINHKGELVTVINRDNLLTEDEKSRIREALHRVDEERHADEIARAEKALAEEKAKQAAEAAKKEAKLKAAEAEGDK